MLLGINNNKFIWNSIHKYTVIVHEYLHVFQITFVKTTLITSNVKTTRLIFTKSILYLNRMEEYGFNNLTNLVGTELASNKNVNFSLQLPGDTSSKLSIHSDTFSGESEYQINLWVPLTNSYETNSMFIFNPKFSKSVTDNLSEYEELGIEMLLEKNKEDYVFLNIPYGKGLIFTPTCLHGNIRNDTDSTRVSFNCRYKNLFSPYCEEFGNEKKLGTFYTPLYPKAATLIGINNSLKK